MKLILMMAVVAVVGVAASVAVFATLNSHYSPNSTSLFTFMASDDFEFLKFIAEHSKSYATKEEFNNNNRDFR